MSFADRLRALRGPAKELVKEALWSATSHRPGDKPDICLYATRRGGSTWVMDLIAATQGVRYIDQPFGMRSASQRHLEHLPLVERGQFIHLAPDEKAQIERFLAGLFSGEIVVNAPWELWRPRYQRVTDRVLLKIVDAKGLMDWIEARFRVQTVYLTRHPIPTALSILRNGWDLTAQAYLHCEPFVEQHLDARQEAKAWDLLRSGTSLQQHVLNWGLENLLPLRVLPDRPHWLHLTYEDCVLHPETVIQALADHLDLENAERMRKRVGTPSRSTKRAISTYAAEQAGMERLARWQRHVDETARTQVQEVLSLLEIDLYETSESLPVVSATGWKGIRESV